MSRRFLAFKLSRTESKFFRKWSPQSIQSSQRYKLTADVSADILKCSVSVSALQDELGVEGVIILPDSKTKLVRIGAGVSTSRSKRSEYVDSKDASAAHDKIKHAASMVVNTKDCRGHVVGS